MIRTRNTHIPLIEGFTTHTHNDLRCLCCFFTQTCLLLLLSSPPRLSKFDSNAPLTAETRSQIRCSYDVLIGPQLLWQLTKYKMYIVSSIKSMQNASARLRFRYCGNIPSNMGIRNRHGAFGFGYAYGSVDSIRVRSFFNRPPRSTSYQRSVDAPVHSFMLTKYSADCWGRHRDGEDSLATVWWAEVASECGRVKEPLPSQLHVIPNCSISLRSIR